MMKLPEARTDKILTTDLEDEVVVYDPERKQAHSLNRTAVAVWRYSDGQSSLAEIRRRVIAELGSPISEASVWLALRKLERAHLLAEKLGSAEPMTRREVLGKAGRFGAAAMIATPIVLSAAVPAAAAIGSPCGTVVCNPAGTCICFATVGAAAKSCLVTAVSSIPCVVGAAGDATCQAQRAGSVC